jgi:DNA-binding GntR family transcriptional regulator
MPEVAIFSLKPATRQTLADSITQSLRDAIFDGLFEPGQRLAEAQLASSLKVSRAPVREALACLEQEGLVSRSAGGATTVSELLHEDVEEICSLRLALEALAVRLAILEWNPTVRQELDANIQATEKIEDPQQLAQRDLEFHEIIVRAANHGRLLASWLNLRSQIRLIMVQRNLADGDSRRGTVQGHKELLEAIEARDPAKAVAVLQLHLGKQYEWILKSFSEAERATPPPKAND